MEEKTVFAENLRKIREYKNLTQQQLADMIGVGKTTISNYEISYSAPVKKKLEKLTEVLGVSVSDLYSESFNPSSVEEGVFQSPKQEKMYIYPTDSPIDILLDKADHTWKYIDMPKSPAMRTGTNIAVKCTDDAMDNAGFSKGDYVIINKRIGLEDGEIYALFADDVFYIRRIGISDDIITLIPDSNYKDYAPVQIDASKANILVVGRVIHSIKSY